MSTETLSGTLQDEEVLGGSFSSEEALNGNLENEALRGYSAYQVAVFNGFEGTEKEWLESLVGKSETMPKIGYVNLTADKWSGTGNLYSQVVSIEGVTENSQVDLTPSVEQLAVFYEKDLAFVTENENGIVTVYAIGQKPTNDYTIQVTITEVE